MQLSVDTASLYLNNIIKVHHHAFVKIIIHNLSLIKFDIYLFDYVEFIQPMCLTLSLDMKNIDMGNGLRLLLDGELLNI